MPSKNNRANHKKIALLGPAHSYSDIASEILAKTENFSKIFARDIDEVFELVEKGKADFGLVPIENKIHGTIREVLDNLFFKNIHIVKELSIPIIHSLITLEKTAKKDIKRIISHEQALAQCKKYLKKNFPKALIEAFSSTSHAIHELLKNKAKNLAVIAPEIIAKGNKFLKILEKGIEDFKDNSTTFVLIGKGKTPEQKNSTVVVGHSAGDGHIPTPYYASSRFRQPKTSIAFYFTKNAPGTLFQVFKDFADAKINLTKIESRPTKKHFGEYIFFIDFDGSTSDKNAQKTLKSVAKKVAKLKVLGSF